MTPDWQIIGTSSLEALVLADEVLVILPPSGKSHESALIANIRSRAYANETQTHQDLILHTGHLDANGAKAFFLVEWGSLKTNALERRWLLNTLAKQLRSRFKSKKVAVYLPGNITAEQVVQAEDLFGSGRLPIGEGALWQSYRILIDAEPKAPVDRFRNVRSLSQQSYRTWVNENPDTMTSLEIGLRMQAFAAARGLEFRTLDTAALKQEGMNLLLAVGQASTLSPSRCHIISSNVRPGDRPLLLIGKGITFDTGGVNLKPATSFVNAMKNDMGGAALMVHIFQALVESGYDRPLVLVIPCCENALGERSFKPGAVIKSRAGTDVFIDNTDAEGRLILVDALHYAQEKFKPALTLTAATLTTASLRQFSHFFTPVHFANDAFKQSLGAIAGEWGEAFTFWDSFLPFDAANDTNAADISNCGRMPGDANIGGGSNVAAHFIRQFARGPLIHFDIFNTVWNWGSDYPGAAHGATGAVFNTLFTTLRQNDNLWGYS